LDDVLGPLYPPCIVDVSCNDVLEPLYQSIVDDYRMMSPVIMSCILYTHLLGMICRESWMGESWMGESCGRDCFVLDNVLGNPRHPTYYPAKPY